MRTGAAIAIGVVLVSGAAHADPGALAVRALGAPAVESLAATRSPSVWAFVRVPPSADPVALGVRPVAPGLAVIEGPASRIAGFSRAHPELSVEVAPPLVTKLDVSAPFVGATQVRAAHGLDGRGTYVGIVDTGLDVFHDDFRNADGSTRVAWFLDFASEPRADNALDQAYGGRVYERAEIDAILKGGLAVGSPGDADGHGTHVAGIAAGSGGPAKRFVGVAPAADLVIVRASDAFGAIDEAKAVTGVRFVFDRAKDAARPAVVNLSLGTQYGAHDGSSSFEQGLSELARGPGRAVVVAASNEGNLRIHGSVRVSPGTPYRIPIRLPGANGEGAAYTDGQVFVWVNLRDRGDVRVGLRGPGDSSWIAPIERGRAAEVRPADGLRAIVANDEPGTAQVLTGTTGAIAVVAGRLPVGTFDLELEGDGAVEIWLQGSRQAIDGPGMPGFARGALQIEGTIGVPASAIGVVSIGCVAARTGFTNQAGKALTIEGAMVGSRCAFSSSGPAADGALRPDVLAPGYYVVSSLARSIASAIDAVQVVDAGHAAFAGTSMSSPFGAGAIALLFQRDPTLTQADARALLQAGARPALDDGHEYAGGAGILDVEGALAALDRKAKPPRATSLQMTLGGSYLASDGGLPLYALAIARDEAGRPADVEGGLVLETDGANVNVPLEHPAVGLYRFAVVAAADRGGTKATLRLKGALSAVREVPVASDRWDARDGVRGVGSCGMGGSAGSGAEWIGVAVAAALVRRRRR